MDAEAIVTAHLPDSRNPGALARRGRTLAEMQDHHTPHSQKDGIRQDVARGAADMAPSQMELAERVKVWNSRGTHWRSGAAGKRAHAFGKALKNQP